MVFDLRILIVENNEKEAQLLKLILESEAFIVEAVSSSGSALKRIKEGKYDAAIVDFALPDMKGDVLAESIKLEKPGMRVILLTGFKQARARDPVRLERFKFVFEKPADPKKIIEVLKKIQKERAKDE